MQEKLAQVRNLLQRHFDSVDCEAFGRFKADFSFGKMLRSKLLLTIAPDSPYSTQMCAIIELIHFASLLHDDVIDSANLRRGKQSINAKHGDKNAIMLGDILYSKAFYEVAGLSHIGGANLAQVISNAVYELSLGELDDVSLGESMNLNAEKYLAMVARKTGALIEASAVCGGVLKPNSPSLAEGDKGGGFSTQNNSSTQFSNNESTHPLTPSAREGELGIESTAQINKYKIYGRNLGIAFQIIDDLLDITQDDSTLGKESFSDFREGKTTLPYIHLYNALGESDKAILKSYFKKPLDSAQKGWIRAKMAEHKIVPLIQSIAKDYGTKALCVLDSSDKNLQKIIKDMIDREF